MVLGSLVGIVIQRQVVIRVRQFPVGIVPDDYLRVFLSRFGSVAEILPQPFMVHTLRRKLPLYPDASMAGLLSQVSFAVVIGPFSGALAQHRRYFVNQDSVIDADCLTV